MKLLKKKNLIKIEKDDLRDAKLSSVDFQDETVKKRAFLNVLGARLAIKKLFSKDIEANNVYSMYTIQNVLKEIDIADIYFNGIRIDVRLVFNQNEIFIPKSHFQYNLLPDLYLVLGLNDDVSNAEFLGFFEPKDLDKNNENNDFYFYEYENLQDPKNIKTFLSEFIPTPKDTPSEDDFQKAQELFLSAVDSEISQEDILFLLQQLSKSFGLREKFVEFENFEVISTKAAKDENVLKDNVLDIVGAQQLFENEELSQAETKAEVIGEVLSDILEEEAPFEIITEETEEEPFEILNEEPENNEEEPIEILPEELQNIEEEPFELPEEQPEQTESNENEEENIIESLEEILEEKEETQETISDFNEIEETETIREENLTKSQDEEFLEKLPELNFETQENEKTPEYLSELSISDKNDEENLIDLNSIEDEFNLELNQNEPEYVKELKDETNQEEQFEAFEDLTSEVKSGEAPPEEDFDINDFDFSLLNENDDEKEKIKDIEMIPDFDPENYVIETPSNVQHEIPRISSEIEPEVKIEEEPEVEYIKEEEKEKCDSQSFEPKEIFDEQPLITKEPIKEIFIQEEEKDPLQVLFKEKSESPTAEFKSDADIEELTMPGKKIASSLTQNNKKMIIAATAASVVLVTFIAVGTISSNNNRNMPNNLPPTSTMQTQNQNPNNQLDELAQNSFNPDTQQNPFSNSNMNQQSIPQDAMPQGTGQEQINKDMGQAVSDAFLSEPVSANISKIAWEVPEDLAYNDAFRKYLQMSGKNLRLNLQNDLLLSNEMAYSNKIILDLAISRSGSLISSNVVTSSGSKEIDKIVLQSVKGTLSYLRMPADELKSNSVNVTLIINF